MPESPRTESAVPTTKANAYEVTLTPARARLNWVLAGVGLAVSVVAAFLSGTETLWGLLPIVLYAVLCLLGMDIIVATTIALLSGLVIAKTPPLESAELLGSALSDQITMIGLIIMLGAGVGEILKITGVARSIVLAVMRIFGERSRTAIVMGVMLSCLVLVACLGTLAGALAIAAPILLPIAARMGFTRSATAAMMFVGGCAGLALAPFAGSNVAIMEAAEIGYGQYVLYGAGPLALLSLVVGVFVVPWMQRRTENTGDFYSEAETVSRDDVEVTGSRFATFAFSISLVTAVVFATVTEAGTTFPLLALPAIGIITGLAGRVRPARIATAMYEGCASLVSIFVLFWLLAALFMIIEHLAPFQVILDLIGDDLAASSPFVFVIVIALLGWVGVPGATAAQVVLLDQVFGELAGALGVSAGAWTIVLLFASKADTYGPFPNGNMVGAMGLARSQNLRNMLITGWILLVPACIMYLLILFFETR